MKKTTLLFSILGIFLLSMAFTLKNFQANNLPHIQFESESHDFGTMTQGGNGDCTFKFTNTGKAPLIISEARASCGCTVPQKPAEPILPGKSDVIKVHYDTQRLGAFQKYITVTSNADNTTVTLTIKGDIKEKPAEEVPVRTNQGMSPIAK